MPNSAGGLWPKFNAIDAAELTERCGDFASDWITAVCQRDALYAALQAAFDEVCGEKTCDYGWHAQARAALAKARGEKDAH